MSRLIFLLASKLQNPATFTYLICGIADSLKVFLIAQRASLAYSYAAVRYVSS
jgi:hypothetical protein